MRETKVNTVTVPTIGTQNPSLLFYANDVPLRILVRNVGASTLIFAHDSPTLTDLQPQANTYQIPPGQADVFVLAPKQGIFAISAGAGGLVSMAISEAIPEFKMES